MHTTQYTSTSQHYHVYYLHHFRASFSGSKVKPYKYVRINLLLLFINYTICILKIAK